MIKGRLIFLLFCLSFVLLENYGLVYVSGHGSVTCPDNQIVKLPNGDLKSEETPGITFDSDKIPQSSTTGTYTGSDYKGNYVYSGAMNLAWNELNENILHEKLKLNTTDEKALEIVDTFNKTIFTKNDLDEASYYVKSGFRQKTVDIINKESRSKFPDKSFGDLKVTLQEKDIIAYAYFLKKVEHATPFVTNNVSFMGERIKGFCAKTKEQKANVEVLKYSDDNKFIIRLKLKDDSDELILAKGFDIGNPDDIVDEIRKYDIQHLPAIGDSDLFEMPKLYLSHSRDYNEVIRKYLANKGFEKYWIEVMQENIKFYMDEKGSRVENEAVVAMQKECKVVKKGRYFVLNKPFWVVMKRKNSRNPYFILGVNNTELMERNIEIASTSGDNNGAVTSATITDAGDNPESQTANEKQPQESAVPSLKITVLEVEKAASEEADNENDVKVSKNQKHEPETPEQGTRSPEQETDIPLIDMESTEEKAEPFEGMQIKGKKTDTPEQEVISWKVSVLKDAGKRKIPVKGAKIFVDDLPFGETDNEGIFKKEVKIGKHTIKVESKGFQPFAKEIEISKGADFTEIVLKWLLSEGTKVPEQQTDKVPARQTEKNTEKPVLKIRVLGDTGMERVPVKGAKILMNGYLCGETDKDGVFTKRERMGDHKLKVEKNGFYPVVQKIEFNEHADSCEIVLEKMSGKR